MNRPITKGQIRAIHVAYKRLDYSEDQYRDMLQARYKTSSCKNITSQQAHDFLTFLNGPRPRVRRPIKNPAPPRHANNSRVVTMPTADQRRLIDALRTEIAWDHEDGYERWLSRCLGMQQPRTKEDASAVIRGLLGLKKGGHGK